MAKLKKMKASKKVASDEEPTAPITGKGKKKKTEKAAKAADSGAVDDLFGEGDDFWDGSGSDVAGSDGPGSEIGESSDEGAFMAPDGDGEMPLDDLGDLDDVGAGAMHEKELAAIKEKDPEFYKFLVENDKSLLDFRAPAEEDEDEAPEDQPETPAAPVERLLTLERFQRIQATAHESFTAFKFALNAFHMAVRSIEKPQGEQDGEEEGEVPPEDDGKKATKGQERRAQKRAEKEAKERQARERMREKRGLMKIDGEATFSAVLEWCVQNWIPLLEHYGGEAAKPGKKSDKKAEAQKFDVTTRTRYPRVKVMAQIFWEETCFLLTHLTAPEMQEFVLRSVSTPEGLSWLWPFKNIRQRFLKRCCHLWSTAPSHAVRVNAFLFVRNAAGMALKAPEVGGATPDIPYFEGITRQVLKSFAEVASWGYSWRSLSTFRFMENCVVELLKLDDATAYRVGYVWIRQLALVMRNAAIASSQGAGAGGKKQKDAEKVRKKRAAQRQALSLIGWPFIRSLYLWSKAIGALPSLKPLAYPLATITTGALKSKLTSLQHFPFLYHCTRCLNRLAASLQLFVPVAAHLVKAFEVLLQGQEKAATQLRKAQSATGQKGDRNSLSATKTPDFEIILRIPDGQMQEALVLEAVGSSLCLLMTDHLGLVSRSPAFPEVSCLVLLHLRKVKQKCRSEPLRRQLKAMLDAADKSAEDVRQRREAIPDPEKALKNFLVFDEASSAMAQQRIVALKQRDADIGIRIAAETREDVKDAKDVAPQPVAETKKERKKRKRQEQGKAKADAELEEATTGKQKKAAKVVKDLKNLPRDRDVLEEMDFSGDEG